MFRKKNQHRLFFEKKKNIFLHIGLHLKKNISVNKMLVIFSKYFKTKNTISYFDK